MNEIKFPLTPRMKGAEVGDLQTALQLLLDRGALLADDPRARAELSTSLRRESADQSFGEATRSLVDSFQRAHNLPASGSVDERTAAAFNRRLGELTADTGDAASSFIVRGTIRFSENVPAIGIAVSAFDRDLRDEQLLGQTRSDGRGAYQIAYSERQFRNLEKGYADLVVKAFAADGAVIATSDVTFNAPRSAVVNLRIGADAPAQSLFERLAAAIRPLLGSLALQDLEEDAEHQDVTFLAGETGFSKSDLTRFVAAHQLAQPELPAEFWFVILRGWLDNVAAERSLREQRAGALTAISSLDVAAVRKSLRRGFNLHEISSTLGDRTDPWVQAFERLVARQSLGEGEGAGFVKAALDHAGVTGPQAQETFARLYNNHKALTPELWTELQRSGAFGNEALEDLRTSFRLAELTHSDFSVVQVLKEEFDIRRSEQVRSLAKLGRQDWQRLVESRHVAGEIRIPLAVKAAAAADGPSETSMYAAMLEREFREAFPTMAFSGSLERATQNGGTRGIRNPGDLRRFLDRHQDFEFLKTPIDDFLDNGVGTDFPPAADPAFRREMKAIQRVFKLAPDFAAVDALLADDLHSAQKVYRLGKSAFVRRYAGRDGFTRDSAQRAWNRAADTHAAALTIVGDLKALHGEALPEVLKNGNEDLNTFPNWNGLFKTGDFCDCEHCRSVLGPAAYFADLLMFLKDRRAFNPAFSVKDVLFRRRPDLGYIELNCENALTPFPYVDTLCEVLEDAVDAAGDNDLEMAGFTAIPADPADAAAAVRQAFDNAFAAPVNDNKTKMPLGETVTVSQVSPSSPDRWVVHGDNATYLLEKDGGPDFFARVLPNTKAGAAELRAYPQYVNPRAYETLRATRYPMALPFDLFADEVRAAFLKTNLRRWDLMRTMRGAAPGNPSDGDIAAEYFGISTNAAATVDERRLTLTADTTVAGQQALWGESGAGWLDAVGTVASFLEKTGLEYNDVVALLDLRFLNPAGDIAIHHLDPSCDTTQKVIQILSPASLDRIHRFLRLWRTLEGWKMWELDLVIRHPRIGNGVLDEAFLIQLHHFEQLRARLGSKATVEHTCALLGDLNTETRFTKVHAKRDDALYQRLFLNRRLINPPDPAFQLDPATGDVPPGQTLAGHHAVLLAAFGLRETDLVLLESLAKASDGTPYITSDLNLANLSFLWRHSWLAKLLKLKIEDWKTVLKLFQQDIAEFANPEAAWTFVQDVDRLKAAGFSLDELHWILAAEPTAKAAVKEADAARFLAALRMELQRIRADYDPARYDFLAVSPPTDGDRLATLLTGLLQELQRDEAAADAFIKTLRGPVRLEAGVQDMPAGFVFPVAIADTPNHIPITYDEPGQRLRLAGVLTDAQRTLLLDDPLLALVNGGSAYRNAIEELHQQSQAASSQYVTATVEVVLPGGLALPADRPSLPARYNSTAEELTFLGVMTPAERLALIAAGNPAAAIDELFLQPRLAVKFYELVFTAPLESLAAAVDFGAQLPPDIASKVAFDSEEKRLRFIGLMSSAEQTALHALAGNTLPEEIAYHTAVNSLAAQPQSIVPPDPRVWLTETDLDASLPANDTLAKRLANAAVKALAYLSRSRSEGAVVQQGSLQVGQAEALTRYLATSYLLLPDTLMDYLLGAFTTSTGVVDYATLQPAFDGWFWISRVAAVLKKWKLTRRELEVLRTLTTSAQLLDFAALPLDNLGPPAAIERFLRTAVLLRLRQSLPETDTTLFNVLENLDGGVYSAASFAADVQRLNEAWSAADVEALVNALDTPFPSGYLLAETWERVRRAFYFLEQLNGSADTVRTFAAAAMNATHAQTVRELLRSKFGEETWLVLCGEIQDVLRERKRDALAAYLLAHVTPADPPSGKWENANDLYANYLLDAGMSSCQMTSRLVQGSGSIQLFVQRCFMGLEPEVVVTADGADGDSAWRWWKWMSKYRVWEANRKVFLWPENWIEPELKIDRSPFMKELETELQQNDIDQYTVETAYQNYLEKLEGVAQLEVAGFYQEDDGDNAIVHVVGRTKGAEPQLYYHRTYDYRQWTPWAKVEVDIQGDYLIPAVIARRLYLFWPVFTEIPDEEGNSTATVPGMSANDQPNQEVQKTKKRLRMQMAVSDFRQGKWTPQRMSKDFHESWWYDVPISKKHYRFLAIDGSQVDGRFAIEYDGSGVTSDGSPKATLSGAFELTGCKGMPEQKAKLWDNFSSVLRAEEESVGLRPIGLRWIEVGSRSDAPAQDFTLQNYSPALPSEYLYLTSLLTQTPGIFHMTPPWHLSYFDKLLFDGRAAFPGDVAISRAAIPVGTWLPFFFNDKKRTFFVLPAWAERRRRREEVALTNARYYPQIKTFFRALEDYVEGLVQTYLDTFDFSGMTPAQRLAMEQFLTQAFPEEPKPPYTDDQIEALLRRWFMRFVHWWLGLMASQLFQQRRFHFKNFYHPFVCDLARLAHNPLKGIPALMRRETQLKNSGFRFQQTYQPTYAVLEPGTQAFYPDEVFDFSPDGAYSSYNWELFFHAPLFIANSLSRNQRFQEAHDWYHFIFNPIGVESGVPGGSAMSKYWITKPFFQTTDPQYIQQRIENIMRMLAGDTSVPGYSSQLKAELEAQVLDWRNRPFEPHRIANYRTVAYQKTVVMRYLDNLIAWGDYLFRQDSMESINEATQLYILAAEILGPRPRQIPPQVRPPVQTFNELEDDFDDFSNALVEVENLVPELPGDDAEDPAPLPMLYFCIPHNEKLLGYWDTIADRLYKIRHCMNIEGVIRQLALFEPPIDPAALVKAVAGGLDISSALADLNAPLPLYRFNVVLQKANDVCNDVRMLGSALLSALEKKDAEAFALLRQSHEIRLLEAMKSVREKQIEDAKENLAAAQKSRELAKVKQSYYAGRDFMNAGEITALALAGSSTLVDAAIAVGYALAGGLRAVPEFVIGGAGFGGSPHATAETGGKSFGSIAEDAALTLSAISRALEKGASIAATVASYERRQDDWDFQKDLADKEIEQIDKSIASAELRIAIAEKELENQVLQIENSKAADAFMRSKYTNQELYQWHIGQISGVYFQSYKLAYDLAKRAERCFRFELGLQDSRYINFGYWDSLKKGLLSGEKLQYDLRRLEIAYLERNRREFELSKQVSLAMLDPLALVRLRETGRCFFRVPEEAFDLDYPGHYFRRIKSVSITLPCVLGPYTTVSCTLRLLKNSIRLNTANGDNGYAHNTDDMGVPVEDTRFIENNVSVKAIAASNAQNDSGIFELSFRDERYLPFEGAGAISEWALELFNDTAGPDFGRDLRQFDYGTITDAVLHIRYTAREDAGPFKAAAIQHLREYYSEDGTARGVRLFNLRQEFPGQWHRFLNPTNPVTGNVFEIEMSPSLFPMKDADKTLKINAMWLLARCSDAGTYNVTVNPPLPPPPPAGVDRMALAKVNQYGGLHFAQKDVSAFGIEVVPAAATVQWALRMTRPGGGNLQADPVTNEVEVKDLILILGYEWES